MLGPGDLGQTIAVFDKSGKAVSSGKQILNLLKEAKAAYQARKAEIAAAKEANSRNTPAPRLRRAYTIDERSVASSRRSERSERSRRTHRESHREGAHREHRPGPQRRHSDSHTREATGPTTRTPQMDITLANRTLSPSGMSAQTPQTPLPPYSEHDPRPLRRNRTFNDETSRSPGHLLSPRRARSSDGIDMDLAYGDPPTDLMIGSKKSDEVQLSGLVGKAKFLLDEAKCVQHSVTATLANLQKNPEAMAAVALILGEISTVVKRMSPGALSQIRVVAPSVFALLTSPQFLIAAGVGVGVTVIALGGYKIIKKIKAKNEAESPEQMIALGSEVSSIENWRQGIEEARAGSIGTSVDGELITPAAARLSRLNLAEEQSSSSRSPGSRPRSHGGHKSVKSPRPHSHRAPSSRDDATSTAGSSTGRERRSSRDERRIIKPKPSPLRSFFDV